MIYGTAPFSTTLNDPYARFQGHSMHSLTLNISETVRDTDINGILDLHRPYSTLSFRMTLSDLAKHLVSRSVARSLYDSWASCLSYAKAMCQRVSPEYSHCLHRNCYDTVVKSVTVAWLLQMGRLLTCTTVIGLVGLPSRPWYFIIPQETGVGNIFHPRFLADRSWITFGRS